MRVKIEQVETLLKTQEPEPQQKQSSPVANASSQSFPPASASTSTNFIIESNLASMNDFTMPSGTPMGGISSDFGTDGMSFDQPGMPADSPEAYPWEMIGLGLDEPLPPQDTIDELYIPFVVQIRKQAMLTELTGIEYTSRESIRPAQ
jgi:hypothetical protein